MSLRTYILMFGLATACLESSALAETITVRSLLKQTDKWPVWARDKTPLNIIGRYEGRVARQFRLAKFHVLLTPARTTSLPAGIKSGQRVTVTGILRKSGNRYSMDVSRIAVGRTDHERLAAGIEKLGPGQAAKWYALADEYLPIAEFYEDDFLKTQIREVRLSAFDRQRRQSSASPLQLQKLVDFGTSLGIDDERLQAIRFESIVAMTKLDKPNVKVTLAAIQKYLPDWDSKSQSALVDKAVEQRFLKDPVPEYEAADATVRKKLHRRYFRMLRLPEMLKALAADGSNGLDVVDAIRKELPEESDEMDRILTQYIDYRLSRIHLFTRRQLDEFVRLLTDSGREAEKTPTVERWLVAQQKRLDNGQLDGLLATAEEYLFAFERWKTPEHRESAVELLKRGWRISETTAPKEATSIAQRLEQFGWTRLKNKWLTTEQVSHLPKDDVELAMREGRVVVGMKAAQIVGTLGQPSKKIRVISSQSIQEIWVYGDDGSSAITVHIERRRRQTASEAVATLVSKRAE